MRQLPDRLSIEDLLLDPQNPRLPENLLGGTQEEILSYLYEHDVLDELADSMELNGFFDNEPLIVLPPEPDGKRIVAEGNRRLATLMILSRAEVAKNRGIAFDASYSRKAIESVPAFEVANRDELAAYLGFRHINGIRTWGANEKARYVWERVNKEEAAGDIDPFFTVGRTVGSNARGVRSSYMAYALLRDERLVETVTKSAEYVARKRFGVWMRLLGSRNVPAILNIDNDARTFAEVKGNLKRIKITALVEIIKDLTPPPGGVAVLADSRDVTAYSDVLGSEEAHALLRETGQLALAKSVLDQSDFSRLVAESVTRVDLLVDMVATQASLDEETMRLIQRLSRLTRSLTGAAKEIYSGEED